MGSKRRLYDMAERHYCICYNRSRSSLKITVNVNKRRFNLKSSAFVLDASNGRHIAGPAGKAHLSMRHFDNKQCRDHVSLSSTCHVNSNITGFVCMLICRIAQTFV